MYIYMVTDNGTAEGVPENHLVRYCELLYANLPDNDKQMAVANKIEAIKATTRIKVNIPPSSFTAREYTV